MYFYYQSFIIGRRRKLKNKINEVMKIHDMDEEYKLETTIHLEKPNSNSSAPRNYGQDCSIQFSNTKDKPK